MPQPSWRQMMRLRRLGFPALIAALTAAIPFVAARGDLRVAAQPADHFKALGPDRSQASDDSLFFPNQFEAATAAQPDPASFVLFSLCRRAPFTSTSLYAPIAGSNADAIVGDRQFELVDGTLCYEPQNEQNIVVNPTNQSNVVTSANDYRFGFQAYVYASSDGGNTYTNVLLPGWDSFVGEK